MALRTRKGSVPEGAVAVTEKEALDYQKTIVREWPSETDVFFLKYASHISFVASVASSVVILSHYTRLVQTKKKLLPFLIPALLAPPYVSYVGTEKLLTDNTLIMKFSCPLCTQLKFGCSQIYTGIIAPIALGTATYVGLNNVIQDYAPHGPKEFWKEIGRVIKSGARRYQFAGLIQVLTILVLPFMQAKEILNVTDTLSKTEGEELLNY